MTLFPLLELLEFSLSFNFSKIGTTETDNPAIIPRNHNVEAALNAAVEGDLNGFQNLDCLEGYLMTGRRF